MTEGGLRGRVLLVTRAREQAAELVQLLAGAGAEAIAVPVMRLEPVLGDAGLRQLERRVLSGDFDELVFTSANAVRLALPPGPPVEGTRLFAIGPGTARACSERGWEVEPLPPSYVAESLAELVVGAGVRDRRVLLARAEGARRELPRRLREAGAEVEEVTLYRMAPEPRSRELVGEALARTDLDGVLFASGSAVDCFLRLAGAAPPPEVLLGCIGPVTAAALRRHGLEPALVAPEHTLPGLVRALEVRLGPRAENGGRP